MIDPTENLKEQLRLASKLVYAHENDEFDSGYEKNSAQLGELVIQLDKHLADGGDLPGPWRRSLEILPGVVAFDEDDARSVREFFDAVRAGRGARPEHLTPGARAKLSALGFFG